MRGDGLALAQETDLRLQWGQRQLPAPSLVAFASLLQLDAVELAAVVDRELDRNPALEREEPERCASCGSVLLPSGCSSCRLSGLSRRDVAPGEQDVGSLPGAVDALAAIRHDLAASLDAADAEVAEHLLGCLDGRGFLREERTALAVEIGVGVDAIDRAIAAIRTVGPVGICSRDVRECLELQLGSRPGLVRLHPILQPLVASHLDDLAAGRLTAIATRLGCEREAVVAAREAMRAELRPCALLDESRAARSSRCAAGGSHVDVVVSRAGADSTDVMVEVVERYATPVVLSSEYVGLAQRTDDRVPSDELVTVRTRVDEGRIFLRRLEQRWRTVGRVVEEVARRQRPFVLSATEGLRPLTRAAVASALGVHESTVSRAVAGRTARLPDGRTVRLAELFGTTPGPRETLRRIIVAESRPLSDQALADELARRGHRVARRTVAKYRALLGQPAAARR